MTGAWLLYSIGVTLLCGSAAWLLSQAAYAGRQPARGYWAMSVTLSVLLPLLQLIPSTVSDRSVITGLILTLPQLTISETSAAPSWSQLALSKFADAVPATWGVVAALLVLFLVRSLVVLRREQRSWRTARIDERPILVSPHTGPALVGFLAPRIVVPQWLLSLPSTQRNLAIQHELEHIQARDPLLNVYAVVLLLLGAWNPLVWWQVRRVREAIEMDCDTRVARRNDAREYGEVLLEVGARVSTQRLAFLTAMTERRSLTERRLAHLLGLRNPPRRVARALLACAGMTLVILACIAPLPTDADRSAMPNPAVAKGFADPHFTPYTTAPELENFAEIVPLLAEQYPPLLREAGISGVALVWLNIDTQGRVSRVRIKATSGHAPLDAAALRVARQMKFSPALNYGAAVAAWIVVPVAFKPGGGSGLGSDVRGSSPHFDVPPKLANGLELNRLVTSEYPPTLRAAGIGGRVDLEFRVDVQGDVHEVRLAGHPVHPELLVAATRIAKRMKFSPAMKDGRPVEARLGMPLLFAAAPPAP